MQEPDNTPDRDAANAAQWVGFELHDGLLQWIVGARMTLQASLDSATDQSGVPKEKVQSALDGLLAAADEGRALITFLERHSAAQINVDLKIVIREAINQIAKHDGPPITLDTSGELVLPQATTWHITRIIQQAIRNAILHAQATTIAVSAVRQDNTLTVLVQDDGVGFDTSAPSRPNHFGLGSMQQRSGALGGNLQIRSGVGTGTAIELTVRIDDSSDD